MPNVHYLTQEDVEQLLTDHEFLNKLRQNNARVSEEVKPELGTDIYYAMVPEKERLDAFNEETRTAGHLSCCIYKLDNDDNIVTEEDRKIIDMYTAKSVQDETTIKRDIVYNLHEHHIYHGKWFRIHRSQFGPWVASWIPPRDDEDDEPVVNGSCCKPDNYCEVTTREDCEDNLDGYWIESDQPCAPYPCHTTTTTTLSPTTSDPNIPRCINICTYQWNSGSKLWELVDDFCDAAPTTTTSSTTPGPTTTTSEPTTTTTTTPCPCPGTTTTTADPNDVCAALECLHECDGVGNWKLVDDQCPPTCECQPLDFPPHCNSGNLGEQTNAGCSPTTTTTTTVPPTTSTPPPCKCHPPDFCGDTHGETGVGECVPDFVVPQDPDCGQTTTPNPCDCSSTTTADPNDPCEINDGCDYVYVPGHGWIKINDNCAYQCPCDRPTGAGDSDCSKTNFPCVPTTSDPGGGGPGVPCLGHCDYIWISAVGAWIYMGGDCTRFSICGCLPPTRPGQTNCDVAQVACRKQDGPGNSTSPPGGTTRDPCLDDCYTTAPPSTTTTTTADPNIGACCFGVDSCAEETQAACEARPPVATPYWQGPGTTCTGVNCPQTTPPPTTTTTTTTTPEPCPSFGCTYQWFDATGWSLTESLCDAGTCPCIEPPFAGGSNGEICRHDCGVGTTAPPNGACCYPDDPPQVGFCAPNQSQSQCESGGGYYVGNNSSCVPNPCGTTTTTPDPLGACCYGIETATQCDELSADDCRDIRQGLWLGAGTDCNPNPCSGGTNTTHPPATTTTTPNPCGGDTCTVCCTGGIIIECPQDQCGLGCPSCNPSGGIQIGLACSEEGQSWGGVCP